MKALTHLLLATFFSFLLISCSGDTSLDTTQNTTITISGKVVMAQNGSGLGNALVRLRINGRWYEVRSTGGTTNTAGDFSFAGLPINASFFIEIVPAEDTLATSYTFGSTQKTDAGENIDGDNNRDEFNSRLASKDMGLIQVYKAETTTITIKDITDGSLITGLGMWVEPEGYMTGNNKVGQVAAPWVQATEESDGVYTFVLPAHGMPIGVYVNSLLTDAGIQYQTLDGDQLAPGNFDNGDQGDSAPGSHDNNSFSDRDLTQVVAGQNIEIFLRRTSPHDLVVSFELFDVDGVAFTDAGAAIALTETSTGNIVSAIQDTTQSNRYTLTTNFRNNLTYVLANLDLTGNSYQNTQATVVFAGGNTAVVNQNGEQEVNIPVTIKELTSTTPITGQVLSSSVVPGVAAEATIVFNQPVTPVGDTPVLARVNTINLNAAADASDNIAVPGIYTVVNSDGALSVAPALTNPPAGSTSFNKYEYTDDAAQQAIFTLPGADATTGNIIFPFETRTSADEKIVSGVILTATNASNTVYQLTMGAVDITDLQKVDFTMLVKADNSDATGVINSSLFAASTTTAVLSDIYADDGDYIDTPSRDLVSDGANPPLITAENGNLDYALPNTATQCVGGTGNCLFRALTQPPATPIGANERILSLVSPAAFYGTIKLTSYTVTSFPAGSATVDTTTTVFDQQISVSSTQDEANAMAASGLADTRGNFELFLTDPENQGLDDKNGDTLGSIFGAATTSTDNGRVNFDDNWTRGYRNTGLNNNIGFRVNLAGFTLPANTANSYLKSITLDMNVIIAGQPQAGTVTLIVQ